METVIQVAGLTKAYGALCAVSGLSLRVGRGEVFGLLGANGAGKSTALECMLGVRRMDQGSVRILGMNPVTQRRQLFERVGVQFQEGSYQDQITVGELCEVTRALYAHPADAQALLGRFGLSQQRRQPVRELSGGQRQRLFIVLALLPNPEVVFLDELTTGLDASARREVWKYLAQLKAKGLSIVLTSHFMDEVETLCDQICILRRGRAAYAGTVAGAVAASGAACFEDAYLWFAQEEKQHENE